MEACLFAWNELASSKSQCMIWRPMAIGKNAISSKIRASPTYHCQNDCSADSIEQSCHTKGHARPRSPMSNSKWTRRVAIAAILSVASGISLRLIQTSGPDLEPFLSGHFYPVQVSKRCSYEDVVHGTWQEGRSFESLEDVRQAYGLGASPARAAQGWQCRY